MFKHMHTYSFLMVKDYTGGNTVAKRTQEPRNVVGSADMSGDTRQNIFFFPSQ